MLFRSQFFTRAFSLARYRWRVKWDADFVATPYFCDFVNKTLDLDARTPMAYQLQCELGDDASCLEEYMFNTWLGYGKYYLWEVCQQQEPHESVILRTPCVRSCSPRIIKNYWRSPPWFTDPATPDAVLADRYAYLVQLLGPEPPAFARSNNPDFATLWAALMMATPELEKYGIYATQ